MVKATDSNIFGLSVGISRAGSNPAAVDIFVLRDENLIHLMFV